MDIKKNIGNLFNTITGGMFGGNANKPTLKSNVQSYSYDTIKSKISANVVTEFGSEYNTFTQSINAICRTRCMWDEKSIILLTAQDDYSIRQSLFLFNNNPNIIHIKSLNDYTDDNNVIFVINQNDNNWNSLIKSNIEILQFVTSNDKLETCANYYIFGNVTSDLPKMLDLYLSNKSKVIGWSGNKSNYERGKSIASALKPQSLSKIANDMNEQVFLSKLQSGNITFDDILFVLNKTDELSNHPLLSKFGFKLSDEQRKLINQQKSIILSMNTKERNDYKLLNEPGRINRIASGSGTSVDQVKNIVNMLQNLKDKSGDIAKMASDPTKLAELMKAFQQPK